MHYLLLNNTGIMHIMRLLSVWLVLCGVSSRIVGSITLYARWQHDAASSGTIESSWERTLLRQHENCPEPLLINCSFSFSIADRYQTHDLFGCTSLGRCIEFLNLLWVWELWIESVAIPRRCTFSRQRSRLCYPLYPGVHLLRHWWG